MENTELKQKSSRLGSLLLLVPGLLLSVIAIILSVVGLGFIPILPALAAVLLCVISLYFFKGSYKKFTYVILVISFVASLVSAGRGTIFKSKVAADVAFDSTLVKSQEGIDLDLNEAFGDSVTTSDTSVVPAELEK